MGIRSWLKECFNPINRITSDNNIKEALGLVHSYTLYVLKNYKMKVLWGNLDGKSGTNIHFCRMRDRRNHNLIVINEKYKNYPPEQIACLITHASCHLKGKADLDEEVYANSLEGSTWRFLKKDIVYKITPLYRRLEKLSSLNYDDLVSYIEKKDFYEEVLGS